MNTNISSLVLSIDGGYYCKINDNLHKDGYCLNHAKLSKHIREFITNWFGLNASQCLTTKSHFFKGRFQSQQIEIEFSC